MAIRVDAGDDGAVVRTFVKSIVETKTNWTDDWSSAGSVRYVYASEVELAIAPTISKAVLQFSAGMIKREDASKFEAETGLGLLNQFVRVSTATGGAPEIYFVGLVVDQSTIVGGESPALVMDMTHTALGLEYLLEEIELRTSGVMNIGATTAQRVKTLMIFNDNFVRGSNELGNRSNSKEIDNGFGRTSAVFSNDGAVWSVLDILKYLLVWFPSPRGVQFTLGGASNALAAIIPPKHDFKHHTLKQAIDALIDHKSGMGWTVRIDTDGNPVIYVFSLLEVDASLGAATLAANPQQIRLDFSDSLDPDKVHFGADTIKTYDGVRVSGAPVRVMFSVCYKDKNLVRGWTDSEEIAYRLGAGTNNAVDNDAARHADKLHHVFTTFVIPSTWGWLAGDGTGAGIDPDHPHPTGNVNPTVTDAAALDFTSSPPIRNFGQLLLHDLPIKLPTGYSSDDPQRLKPEYRKMFVLMPLQLGSGPKKWFYVHNEHDPHQGFGSVRPLDAGFGFEVRCSPPHVIAKNQFSCSPDAAAGVKASTSGHWQGKYDWQEMIATVSAHTDTPIRAVRGDPGRVRELYLADAEVWYVAPHTVLDVNSDGTLLRQGTDPSTLTLRNDADRINRAADLAAIWYLKQRNTVRFTARHMRSAGDFPAGGMIISYMAAGEPVDVNTIISRVVYNFSDQTTLVETAYLELDVASIYE